MDTKVKTINAINNNEFIQLLEGTGQYKAEPHQWVGAHVPTDVQTILTKGIYEVYNDNSYSGIDRLLEESLLKMLSGSLFDIYCALSVIFSQLIEESYDSSPFKIDRITLLSTLKNSLISHESQLKTYFEWEGMDKPEGVWSVAVRINSICQKHWGIKVI